MGKFVSIIGVSFGLFSSTAQGGIVIAVDAQGASGYVAADSSTVSDQSALVMSGRAGSGAAGSFAFVTEGGAFYCQFGADCASIASTPSGATAGVVDMTKGSIKAFAKGHDAGGAASGNYAFDDAITFGASRVIKLNLDLPSISHTGPGEGSAGIFLDVVQILPPDSPPEVFPVTFFHFEAQSKFDGSYYSYAGISGSFYSPGPIPGAFEFLLDFGQFPFSLFPDPLAIGISLNVGAECGGPCTSIVRADSSLYVTIAEGYTSQNGYSYPGIQQEPGGEVPEPSALLLLSSGLALLLVRHFWK